MERKLFEQTLRRIEAEHKSLTERKNEKDTSWYNGVYDRYKYPVITNMSIPLTWRYDLNYERNPYLMERIGVNAAFNSGAIFFEGKYVLVIRVEGNDRKSYFAVARSENGIDNFVFDEYPVKLPIHDEIDTNVYDMRLTQHEDGWIYGLFCSERKDKTVDDTSSAVAKCGICLC